MSQYGAPYGTAVYGGDPETADTSTSTTTPFNLSQEFKNRAAFKSKAELAQTMQRLRGGWRTR